MRVYAKLPVVDFASFRTGSTEDRKRTASEVDDALKTAGFFHLQNHGIPQQNIEDLFEKSKEFFILPNDEKEKLTPTLKSREQGYFGEGKETIRGQASLKENFDFTNPDSEGFSGMVQSHN